MNWRINPGKNKSIFKNIKFLCIADISEIYKICEDIYDNLYDYGSPLHVTFIITQLPRHQ